MLIAEAHARDPAGARRLVEPRARDAKSLCHLGRFQQAILLHTAKSDTHPKDGQPLNIRVPRERLVEAPFAWSHRSVGL
jgi:hypothetical protein